VRTELSCAASTARRRTSARRAALCSAIVCEANRASEVIARVRALLSKTETGRQHVDINEAIDEGLALIRGELRKTRVRH